MSAYWSATMTSTQLDAVKGKEIWFLIFSTGILKIRSLENRGMNTSTHAHRHVHRHTRAEANMCTGTHAHRHTHRQITVVKCTMLWSQAVNIRILALQAIGYVLQLPHLENEENYYLSHRIKWGFIWGFVWRLSEN